MNLTYKFRKPKNPTFEDCIQHVKTVKMIEEDNLTIGLEIKGDAVYIGREFSDLRRNGMKFIIKKGTKLSEIGEFLGFDSNEKLENIHDPSKKVKIIVGSELYYKTDTLLDDLKEILSTLVPEDFISKTGKNKGLIKHKSLSNILGKTVYHINSKYQQSKKPDYKIPIEVLSEYLNSLRENSYINSEISSIFKKYIKYNDCPLLEGNKIYNHHPKLKKNYFKYINTLEKAYWLGWIFAEGNLYKSNKGFIKFSITCDTKDGELMRPFIWALGLNPKYVEYHKRYYILNENDKKVEVKREGSRYYIKDREGSEIDINKGEVKISRVFFIQLSNNEFANILRKRGMPIGKKANKIRFPQLRSREMQLAFLLGFFDGDGYLRLDENGEAKEARLISKSKRFLEDLKNIFEIDNEIFENCKLRISGKIYNEMMDLPLKSLERKRSKFSIERINNQEDYRKMKFTKEELIRLVLEGYSNREIAEIHKNTFDIELTPPAVYYYTAELRKSKTNLLK